MTDAEGTPRQVVLPRAVVEQALEALTTPIHEQRFGLKQDAIVGLSAALAQEEQEPVLVAEKEPDYMSRGHFYEGSKPFIDPTLVWKLPIGTKLYTAPPRREWQSLSEQERHRLWRKLGEGEGIDEYAEAIEQALKEKNNG